MFHSLSVCVACGAEDQAQALFSRLLLSIILWTFSNDTRQRSVRAQIWLDSNLLHEALLFHNEKKATSQTFHFCHKHVIVTRPCF